MKLGPRKLDSPDKPTNLKQILTLTTTIMSESIKTIISLSPSLTYRAARPRYQQRPSKRSPGTRNLYQTADERDRAAKDNARSQRERGGGGEGSARRWWRGGGEVEDPDKRRGDGGPIRTKKSFKNKNEYRKEFRVC